jgi:hypothetical protein
MHIQADDNNASEITLLGETTNLASHNNRLITSFWERGDYDENRESYSAMIVLDVRGRKIGAKDVVRAASPRQDGTSNRIALSPLTVGSFVAFGFQQNTVAAFGIYVVTDIGPMTIPSRMAHNNVTGYNGVNLRLVHTLISNPRQFGDKMGEWISDSLPVQREAIDRMADLIIQKTADGLMRGVGVEMFWRVQNSELITEKTADFEEVSVDPEDLIDEVIDLLMSNRRSAIDQKVQAGYRAAEIQVDYTPIELGDPEVGGETVGIRIDVYVPTPFTDARSVKFTTTLEGDLPDTFVDATPFSYNGRKTVKSLLSTIREGSRDILRSHY